METINQMLNDVKRMRKRMVLQQTINFALIVCSALMIWKSLMIVTGSESPIVVVLSGSMEPSFNRGDLLFLSLTEQPFRVGDIVVFKLEGRDIPIVHRILKVHEKPNKEVDVLTKGDNNEIDDRGLYPKGQLWLNKKHIIGRANGYLPYIGMVTIIMNDFPSLKYGLIALMGIFVLVNRE